MDCDCDEENTLLLFLQLNTSKANQELFIATGRDSESSVFITTLGIWFLHHDGVLGGTSEEVVLRDIWIQTNVAYTKHAPDSSMSTPYLIM
jgi:hypothetical protein